LIKPLNQRLSLLNQLRLFLFERTPVIGRAVNLPLYG